VTPELTSAQIEITAAIVERAGPACPLDHALRTELRRAKGLPRNASGPIAEAAHAYFRWLGWLNPSSPIQSRLSEATRLDRQFQDNPRSFKDADLLEHSVPSWVRDTMDCPAAFVRTLQQRPVLWLRARHGTAPALAEKLFHAAADTDRWKDAVRYEGIDDLYRTALFHEGAFEIQDLNSQAIGWICAPKSGETWWDVCAGEGGKTLHFSDLMANKGTIWATDNARWRLDLLRRRAARAHCFNYRVRPWLDPDTVPIKTRFDGVLVDAPCSGVGTWQRNPHARWTTTPDSVERLAALQLRLLRQVAASLKPGGRLIYSVCTLTRRETDALADEFEQGNPEFSPEVTLHPWSGKSSARLWFWPQETGGNGMFAAVWKRRN
jgi:16S rRNA (cytosine967-C5)-methyltransferase